jgi:phosphoglycolate phosphatase-like HAD superfamily hydrolase
MRHVVWDWNGTLFDDLHLVVEAVNAVMADAGLHPITADDYRRLYTRPVHRFYERLYGRPVRDDEWVHLDRVFHDAYADELHRAGLSADALHALGEVERAGRSQSLLSMYRHDALVPLVTDLGVHDRFVLVEGLRGEGGGHKATHLEAHLARVAHVAGEDPDRIVVVGDALDDLHAAQHVGARCVLYDAGSHPREELEATGAPIADSLVHALELAGL